MNITQATWNKAMRGAGVSTCAGESAKNIFSRKYNSSPFICRNRSEESGGRKSKGACGHRASRNRAGMMRRSQESSSSKLFCSWPIQAMATRGKCMAGRRPLDLSVLWGCHPPGMREGIDAPLCGGSNRHMDPRTGLLYFPNQRLSGIPNTPHSENTMTTRESG